MPSLSGLIFRTRLALNAFVNGTRIFQYPIASSSIFDLIGAETHHIDFPERLSGIRQSEQDGNVQESSEPDVARTLYFFARLMSASTVVEVGVFTGFTSQFLASAVAKNQGHLHLVDMDAEALSMAEERAAAFGPMIHTHLGRSIDSSMLKKIPNECDLVYLDADHSENGVRMELNAWLPKVRDKGIIAIHDSVHYPGICRAVNEQTQIYKALTVATSRGCGLTIIKKESR